MIKDVGTKFEITEEGNISDFLGVKFDYLKDGRVRLSQPQLEDSS